MVHEAAVRVEVDVLEHPLPDDLIGDLAFEVHEHLEHVVVGLSGKHDLPGVEFVNGRSCAPEVDEKVVFETENDFGRAVEPRHQVGSQLRLRHVRRGTEIAKLEEELGLVDEDVVRLDVRVNYIGLLHDFKRQKQLLGVGSDRFYVKADVFSILLQNLP